MSSSLTELPFDEYRANVLVYTAKDGQRYTFLYSPSTRAECLRLLGKFASDKNLAFSWYDAAVISQKLRQQSEKERGLTSIPSNRIFPFVDVDLMPAGGFLSLVEVREYLIDVLFKNT